MRRPSHPRRRRAPRAWAAVLVVARMLALLLGLQLGGMTHVVADVVAETALGASEHGDDCPPDRPCDCPPGCPKCHCSCGMPLVVPDLAAPLALVLPSTEVPMRFDEATAPARPLLDSVYRPPRVARASS